MCLSPSTMMFVVVTSPIHTAVWMQGSCANSPPLCECFGGGEGGSVRGAVLVNRTSVNRQTNCAYPGCVGLMCDNYTGPSRNKIKRNVPQRNVTWPNKSNVMTVTVFGNLYEEKDTTDIRGEASVLPPVLLTLCHISARKTASVTSKKL